MNEKLGKNFCKELIDELDFLILLKEAAYDKRTNRLYNVGEIICSPLYGLELLKYFIRNYPKKKRMLDYVIFIRNFRKIVLPDYNVRMSNQKFVSRGTFYKNLGVVFSKSDSIAGFLLALTERNNGLKHPLINDQRREFIHNYAERIKNIELTNIVAVSDNGPVSATFRIFYLDKDSNTSYLDIIK